jgi:pantoate--beta-alanine ligase
MLLIREPDEYRAHCAALRETGTLGFVPTMGALHEGHLALMRSAKQLTDRVAVSIFVNPTQFGPSEDFSRYPRDLGRDLRLCESAGVGLVFAPEASAMYPTNERTRVSVKSLTEGLCGTERPGHFDGVCTIVCKLFGLTGPCTAIFGRKDYQQLKVIEKMVGDLFLPVSVIGHRIVREPDGLAMSSRNRTLSADEHQQALAIGRSLAAAERAFAAGERAPSRLEAACRAMLRQAGLRESYVSCVHPNELTPWPGSIDGPHALLAIAAFAGATRLIDNCLLGENES